MKTAEEQAEKIWKFLTPEEDWHLWPSDSDCQCIISQIQQIQLDAMKEGMRRAAVVAEGETYATGGIRNDEEASYEKGCLAAQKAILTAAERWMEKDL